MQLGSVLDLASALEALTVVGQYRLGGRGCQVNCDVWENGNWPPILHKARTTVKSGGRTVCNLCVESAWFSWMNSVSRWG